MRIVPYILQQCGKRTCDEKCSGNVQQAVHMSALYPERVFHRFSLQATVVSGDEDQDQQLCLSPGTSDTEPTAAFNSR